MKIYEMYSYRITVYKGLRYTTLVRRGNAIRTVKQYTYGYTTHMSFQAYVN